MNRIAIFASGTGTNAENIIAYFAHNPSIQIVVLVSNNAGCGAVAKAKQSGVEVIILSPEETRNGIFIIHALQKRNIDYVVLAGYLKMIPVEMVKYFKERILNIHPALLPKFGGAGMYGKHVHQAVVAQNETESGITIHLVNEEYDKGRILAQKKVPVNSSDTWTDVENKVRQLELEWYPKIIEQVILLQKKTS